MKKLDSAPCASQRYILKVDETYQDQQLKDTYHADIGNLLKAAYGRECNMMEKGKCKVTFPDAKHWYNTLSDDQRKAVDEYIGSQYVVENREGK